MKDQVELRVKKLIEDIEYATATISQSARGINLALASLYFLFSIGVKDGGIFFASNRSWIAIASVMGAVGVLFDLAQYYTSRQYLRKQLEKCQKLVKSSRDTYSLNEYMPLESDFAPKIRGFFFHAKVFSSIVGCSVLIFVLLRNW